MDQIRSQSCNWICSVFKLAPVDDFSACGSDVADQVCEQ